MGERWYERYARAFQHEFEARKPVVLYADHPDFQQTNTLSGFIGEGTGGVTESLKNRVIMPLTGSYFDTDHVLGHELVHAFQYNIAQTRRGGGLQGHEHPARRGWSREWRSTCPWAGTIPSRPCGSGMPSAATTSPPSSR